MDRRTVVTWAAVAVIALALVSVLPSFVGWHLDDDLRNLRWALEYRFRPWVAITERHAVHDHVRPAVLIATWLGAALSSGAWWGPHLVLVVLVLAGLAGMATFAARLAGDPRAGLLAALLAMGLAGWHQIALWNAWVSSAGEIACGFWGLVFAHRALERREWPIAAAALMIGAGMFKEPGWVVYPAAAAALAAASGRRDRRTAAVGGLLGLGALGFLATWHPTNLFRTEAAQLTPVERLSDLLTVALPGLVDTAPFTLGEAGQGLGAFVALPLLLLAAWPGGVSESRRPAWVAASIALVAGVHAVPVALGALLLIGAAAALPSPAAVVFLGTVLVMAPFDKPNPTQMLPAGYALAILISVAAFRRMSWGRDAVSLALGAGILWAGLGIGARALTPDTEKRAERLAARDHLVGLGVLARSLDTQEAATRQPLGDLMIAPSVGLGVTIGEPPWPAVLAADGHLRFRSDGAAVARLMVTDGLAGREVPLDATAGDDRPRPGSRAPKPGKRSESGRLRVEVGWWALGIASDGMSPAANGKVLVAQDGCGHRWEVLPPPPGSRYGVVVGRTEPGCNDLDLAWTDASARASGTAFFVRLGEPRTEFFWAPFDGERVDVGITDGGVVPELDRRDDRGP